MKIKGKFVHLSMRRLLVFIFITVIAKSTFADPNITSYREMIATFGNNKKILKDIEAPAIIALSFYPELKNTKISFEYKEISTTMSTMPELKSALLFQRSYVIYINSDATKYGAVSYNELSLKQQVGLIAHELAHVVYFENQSNLAILGCGFMYECSPQYHMNLEKATDETVINRGLGEELYAFTNYVINQSKASAEYIAFKKKNYLLPEEIKQRMK